MGANIVIFFASIILIISLQEKSMKKRNTSLCYISKFLIVLGFLASTINAECVAQQNNSVLDKGLEQIYRKSDFPGFAVSIIRNDSVLFAKGYGFANI
jgi:hypothetical protein